MTKPNFDIAAKADAEGWFPMAPKERTWGTVALMGVAVSAAVATWVFLIGGTVAYYLSAVPGTLVMLAGSLVGILLVILATLPVASRYGIDSIAALRPQLGTKGAYFGLALLGLANIGWNAVLVIFMGRACGEILESLSLISAGSRAVVEPVISVVFVAIVWLVLRRGTGAVQKAGVGVAAIVMVLGVFILFLVLKQAGLSTILEAEPLAPSESKMYNMTTGFEMLVATNLAWWPYVGGLVRMTSGPRKALWPIVLGIGIPVGLLSVIGLAAALAVPESGGDPTQFLIALGGLQGGVPALAFIVLANFGTVLVCTYISAVGLGQVTSLQGRLSWGSSTMYVLLPVAILSAFFAAPFYDNITIFLAFLGVAFAPICGIQIADNYFLKRPISLRGMFIHGPGTPYHYWKGVNPIAVVALIVGALCYLYLLDPLTYESRAPYEYVSATLPSVLFAGLTYFVLMKWAAPRQWLDTKDAVGAQDSA
jgi:NCS1 family nucleobase:cation symporter-1